MAQQPLHRNSPTNKKTSLSSFELSASTTNEPSKLSEELHDETNQKSSSSTSSSSTLLAISPTTAAAGPKASSNNEHLPKRNPLEKLYSSEKWGTKPIRQDIRWELPPSPTPQQSNPIQQAATQQLASSSMTSSQFNNNMRQSVNTAAASNGPIWGNDYTQNVFNSNKNSHNNMGADNINMNNNIGTGNLGANMMQSSRFDQHWRAPASKLSVHQQSALGSIGAQLGNNNLFYPPGPVGMQKMLNNGNNNCNGVSPFMGNGIGAGPDGVGSNMQNGVNYNNMQNGTNEYQRSQMAMMRLAAMEAEILKAKQTIADLQDRKIAEQHQQANFENQNQAHVSSRQPTMPNFAAGGSGIGPAPPPGISQTSDSFLSGSSVNDFNDSSMMNNFGIDSMGINGLANSIGHMNLGSSMMSSSSSSSAAVTAASSRYDQSWRNTSNNNNSNSMSAKAHQSSLASGGNSFGNAINLINHSVPPIGMQSNKSMINGSGASGSSANLGVRSAFVNNIHSGAGGGDFHRAPGQASALSSSSSSSATAMMNNNMTQKSYGNGLINGVGTGGAGTVGQGVNNRLSSWSAFGPQQSSSSLSSSNNEPDFEWPKTTISGISAGNPTHQQSNAVDMVPEFEPGKPWRGSMLMKSVEEDSTLTPGSMARSLAPQRKTIWSDELF